MRLGYDDERNKIMNARLIKLWQDLQGSYYFIPGVMAIGSIILALVTAHIDRIYDYGFFRDLGWFYSNSPESARVILSTIAGSMITVAGVTFSMTMVAVSSAAAQYGPRLIGNFMRDRANQFTLGTFTSTFVYCLLILRVTRTGDTGGGEDALADLVPNFSLLVAFAMTLGSVAVLIYFVHHIPETLNVGNITSRVGRKLRKDITELFPNDMGLSNAQESTDEADYDIEKSISIDANAEGYLQALDNDAVLKFAVKHGAVVKLQYRPGDFVVKGNVLLNVWARDGLGDEARDDFRGCFAMGRERTAYQNTLFLADELVEILGRALSPGINDPFTAINCMNWYHSAVNAMCAGRSPSPYRFDEKDNLRVIAHPTKFERLAEILFGQSRPYVAADRNAALHMMKIITECAAEAQSPSQKDILIRHLEALYQSAMQALKMSVDREEIENRFSEAKKMLADKKYYLDRRNNQSWIGGRA